MGILSSSSSLSFGFGYPFIGRVRWYCGAPFRMNGRADKAAIHKLVLLPVEVKSAQPPLGTFAHALGGVSPQPRSVPRDAQWANPPGEVLAAVSDRSVMQTADCVRNTSGLCSACIHSGSESPLMWPDFSSIEMDMLSPP